MIAFKSKINNAQLNLPNYLGRLSKFMSISERCGLYFNYILGIVEIFGCNYLYTIRDVPGLCLGCILTYLNNI